MNDTIIKDLLETIADITGEVSGAYNLRSNGCGVERRSSENIKITPKDCTNKKPISPKIKSALYSIKVLIYCCKNFIYNLQYFFIYLTPLK